MAQRFSEHFSLLPGGGLQFSGVDLAQLAKEYGTPLYVMSEPALRQACRAFVQAVAEGFGPGGRISYASKALCAGFIYPILHSEGLHADVVSGGELYTALKAGFPAGHLHFHGNYKTDAELDQAVAAGVGAVVIDGHGEIARLDRAAGRAGKVMRALVRVKPGIEAHTHAAVMTGQVDSKFGFGLEDGQAMAAVKAICQAGHLEFWGIHCHIGSQIFTPEAFILAAGRMVALMAEIRRETGITCPQLILGGGFGVRYMPQDDPLAPGAIILSLAAAVRAACDAHELPLPQVVLEPGRAVVAHAGITLYTVGEVRDIPGGRCYVAIDGSMADNPRYALYEARYDVDVVGRAGQPKDKVQTVAGRCCESGDLITRDVPFQPAEPGDLLCVYATGAYNYAMASNYNRLPRPAMVLITPGGGHRLVVRRERYEDLVRSDLP